MLTLALLVAKEKMESTKNWNSCCEEAVIAATRLGIKAGTHSRTVRNWYQNFRIQRKITVLVLPGKHNLPPFLQQNKDIATSIQQYAREHLHELSVELIAEYIHSTVLPKMVEEANDVKIGDDR